MDTVIEVKDLVKFFPVRKGLWKIVGFVKAVDRVSFSIREKETLGVVGESGCGKTTLGRCILRLIKPDSGEVYFKNVNIMSLKGKDLKNVRRKMQIVFQDPYSSLNPRMTVRELVSEPLLVHKLAEGKEREERTIELLNMVGLSEEFLNKYPHELSGGQRQRVTIARALASNPEFLVLDEPTSSLDVSVGAQILNLLKRLQQELGLTYMFISHNFYVVRFMSNRIAVMYLGKIVELADAKELILNPLHPYTKALLSAIPVLDPEYKDKKERIILPGDPPSPVNPPSGCRFHPRCVYAMDICKKEEPPLIEVKKDHLVACHLLTT